MRRSVMKRAACQGDRVTVSYTGTLDNGRIFHSTEGGEPLVFTIGSDEVFPALEREIIGMVVGQVKNIVIAAADAYGPRQQENIIKLDRAGMPDGEAAAVGRKVQISFSGGVQRVMQIVEVTESTVTLDGNHPLAGLDLTFALRLDHIEEP
jgi:peptidylprolyl isomerase